jgi:hypothetical protein
VDTVSQPSEVLDAMNARMTHPAPQPEARVQPLFVNDGPGKSHTGLEDDAALLGVDGNRPARAGNCYPAAKGRTQRRGLSGKVARQRKPPAGVPQIPRHESMTTFRALPKSSGAAWQTNSRQGK